MTIASVCWIPSPLLRTSHLSIHLIPMTILPNRYYCRLHFIAEANEDQRGASNKWYRWGKEYTCCHLPYGEGLVPQQTEPHCRKSVPWHIFVFLNRSHGSFKACELGKNPNTSPHCFNPYMKVESHFPHSILSFLSLPAQISRPSLLGCCLLKARARHCGSSLCFQYGTIFQLLWCAGLGYPGVGLTTTGLIAQSDRLWKQPSGEHCSPKAC